MSAPPPTPAARMRSAGMLVALVLLVGMVLALVLGDLVVAVALGVAGVVALVLGARPRGGSG